MSDSILAHIDEQSDYAFPQLLAYIRFHERAFELRIEFLKNPIRAAIWRAVGARELSHGTGTNAASIAQSIPVPRETVRRHLSWLEKHDWVVKDGANYRIGPALLGEPLDKLDELIADFLKTADLVREYKRNLP